MAEHETLSPAGGGLAAYLLHHPPPKSPTSPSPLTLSTVRKLSQQKPDISAQISTFLNLSDNATLAASPEIHRDAAQRSRDSATWFADGESDDDTSHGAVPKQSMESMQPTTSTSSTRHVGGANTSEPALSTSDKTSVGRLSLSLPLHDLSKGTSHSPDGPPSPQTPSSKYSDDDSSFILAASPASSECPSPLLNPDQAVKKRPTHRTLQSFSSLYSVASHLRPMSAIWDEESSEDQRHHLETLLKSNAKVGNACVVAPQAGAFEGQVVALITSNPPIPNVMETTLLPQTADDAVRRQITALRAAVADWEPDSPKPDVWVSVQSMATDRNGNPDTREVQTWVQNLGEEPEKRIMDLQLATTQRQKSRRFTRAPRLTAPAPMPLSRPFQILEQIEPSSAPEVVPSVLRAEEQTVTKPDLFPLSVMQQLYFRTSMNRNVGEISMSGRGFRFSQSLLLNIKANIELADIEAAVDVVVSRHSMLRARFQLTHEGWAQVIQSEKRGSYRFGHQHAYDDVDIQSIIETSQSYLNILKGPVFAVEHIRCNDGRQLLYLVAHHLVVDLTSWRTLTNDLEELLQNGTLSPSVGMTFPNWIDYQGYEADKRLIEPTIPSQLTPVDLQYWGLANQLNCYGDTERASFQLDEKLASTIRKTCSNILRTTSEDFFLAALLYSFYLTFTDRHCPTVWRQEQGRDSGNAGVDIERTVGWFTTLCPINLSITSESDLIQLVKETKDMRRSIPRNGAPYFVSKFSGESAMSSLPLEVMFNCVDTLREIQPKGGVLEIVASPSQDAKSLISDVGPEVGRLALFEVSIVIDDSGAQIEAMYNKNTAHQHRVKSWIERFQHLILEGAGKMETMEPELTLADAPLLDASYGGMSKLTSQRLAQVGIDSAGVIDTLYPVSPMQQDILIAQAQQPDDFLVSATYEVATSNGSRVDTNRVCAAWETLVALHPQLRSVFIDGVSENSLFDQVVLKRITPSMLFLDSENPMEMLAAVPPMKAVQSLPRHRLSVSSSSTKTYLRLDVSQALCDSQSLNILVAELNAVYAGADLSTNDRLSAHLGTLAFQDDSYSLVIWKASLAGAQSCQFPRLTSPSDDSQGLRSQHFEFDTSRSDIVAFGRDRGFEVSTVLQMAWALALRAFAGTDLVSFGYEGLGRNDTLSIDAAESVGCFANIQPRFIDFTQAKTIQNGLVSLKNLVYQTSKHHVPSLSEIEHGLGLTSDGMFNTCVSVRYAQEQPASSPNGLASTLVASCPSSSGCELSLAFIFRGEKLSLDMTFKGMTSSQAGGLASTVEKALWEVLSNPAQRVSEAELFTARGMTQLAANKLDRQVNACLHSEILRHANANPEDVAIRAWDGKLTYRQMERYVSKLSAHLQNSGIGPGAIVPLVVERNKWTPVIMLAILQSGACFVSLDCQDKATVLSTIQQINPLYAVTTDSTWRFISTIVPTTVLVNTEMLNTLPPQVWFEGKGPSPESAACVFFSPGQNDRKFFKGMYFTHTSLCSAFTVQGPALKMSKRSRVMQLSSLNVDISLVEIMCSLFQGGCVCIPSEEDRLRDITGALSKMKANWTYMTTTISRKIDPSSVPHLKTLCFRTRVLHQDMFQPWIRGRNVLLAYGAPDICPLAISVHNVSQSQQSNIIAPPLMGKFWVVNPDDPAKFMPSGTVGELAIECPALAPHRYVSGMPLVASSAVSTYSEASWKSLLLTGHRVRALDGGNIEFISSMRDEIVMNGCPVVMTDIEQLIRQCLGQDVDVFVEPITTSDSIKILAAFIELGRYFDGPSELHLLSMQTREKTMKLKERIQIGLAGATYRGKQLPPFCTPSVFIPVRNFPLSTSLKVKRRRLMRTAEAYSYEQLIDLSSVANTGLEPRTMDKPLPLTQMEVTMLRIWAQVLEKPDDSISTTKSFFDEGGNKFLAAKLVLECRQKDLHVSLPQVLNGATMAELCRALSIASQSYKINEASETTTVAKSIRPEVPRMNNRFIKKLIAPELRLEWQAIMDVTEATSQQIQSLEVGMYTQMTDTVCLAVSFHESVSQERLQAACEIIVDVHPILRTAFAVHACRVYQAAISSFAPEFECLECDPGRLDQVADGVIREQQQLPFDMKHPVTKFTLIESSDAAKLIIRLSGSQMATSSVGLLVQDLITLYEDPDASLQRPTFFDYARATQSVEHQQNIPFWKKALDGAAMTHVVSHIKPSPPVADVGVVNETIRVDSLGHYGFTFDTVLKAAWAIVLSTTANRDDVLFGELVDAQRTEGIPEAPSVVGPMQNTVPVRIRVPAASSVPLDFMQKVHGDHLASRPFEATSALELIKECTDMPHWERFSTLVQHRLRNPSEESAVLNTGNTPFTYKFIDSRAKALPDLLVSSTSTLYSDEIDLAIHFCSAKVPPSFAREALTLLIQSIQMLTSLTTINDPTFKLPSVNGAFPSRIPLYKTASSPDPSKSVGKPAPLSGDNRQVLQRFITSTWTDIFNPIPSHVCEADMHRAAFYDLWGTVVPAQLFADHFNKNLHTLDIPSVRGVRVSPEDMVDCPTMLAQYDLIVRKGDHQSKRKTRTLSINGAAAGLKLNTSWAGAPASPQAWGSGRTPSLRDVLRRNNSKTNVAEKMPGPVGGVQHRSSMRDLGVKAGDWFRDKVAMRNQAERRRRPLSISTTASGSASGSAPSATHIVVTRDSAECGRSVSPVTPPVEIDSSEVPPQIAESLVSPLSTYTPRTLAQRRLF